MVPLGLDLERFSNVTPADGVDFRESVGAGSDDVLLTCVCRLVPHKRVDLLLRVIAAFASHIPPSASRSSAMASTGRHWSGSPMSWAYGTESASLAT